MYISHIKNDTVFLFRMHANANCGKMHMRICMLRLIHIGIC